MTGVSTLDATMGRLSGQQRAPGAYSMATSPLSPAQRKNPAHEADVDNP
ncbi:MAG: hypothetical protein HY706_18520 [Candidatus Hydrogenedentes bacterium]|nr:hypothetical protein [Candidatus Hydrogenedentota bacterium]